MVLGVVRDHHHATAVGKAGLVKLFHKFKKGQAVEFVHLSAKLELPIAQPARRQNTPRCAASGDAITPGPWFLAAPTSGNGNRAAGSALHRWPTGLPKDRRLTLGVFFMGLLPFRVGPGNRGARFAQAETQLPEQTLALSHSQPDPILPF